MTKQTQNSKHIVTTTSQSTLPVPIAQGVTKFLEKIYGPDVEKHEELSASDIYQYLHKRGPTSIEQLLRDLDHDDMTYIYVVDIMNKLKSFGYVKAFSKSVIDGGISQKLRHYSIAA